MGIEPVLCVLQARADAATADWLQATWEGMVSRAYRSAQQFVRRPNSDHYHPEVRVGPASLLQTYLKASALDEAAPRLQDGPRCLNLITVRSDADLPVNFDRLRAVWPGPVFRFDPELTGAASADGEPSSDVLAILGCLLLAGGCPEKAVGNLCPLKTMLWSAEAAARILTRASAALGDLLRDRPPKHFRGSNEGSTALALKADVAAWVRRGHAGSEPHFESGQVEDVDEMENVRVLSRVDLFVERLGRFEIESLVGSGPIEAFYHQKVFARVGQADSPFWLVVPSGAMLWAGPYLADLAHHLAGRGHVLVPGLDGSYLQMQGRLIGAVPAVASLPSAELSRLPGVAQERPPAEPPVLLKDVAGYSEIRARVEELIIWPERHLCMMRRTSRSSGILFFGPPGCGKSRLARAIAGELEQEVRLLSPSDLRGAYLGWGQVMIREQFDWVAENDRRMLVIDELDAVARTRREVGNMHSDEKASVNELLVQLDRVGRLGRLVVGTTNYVSSLDEAVIRSGRFGRFVPVPPPTLDEATAIVTYYLAALREGEIDAGPKPNVQVLPPQAVRGILKTVCEQNARERRFFCGADLGEAVNRAYVRRLREAVAKLPAGTDYAALTIDITGQDLFESLREVPRSVNDRSVKRFLCDVDRFCGSMLMKQLSDSLCAAGNGP